LYNIWPQVSLIGLCVVVLSGCGTLSSQTFPVAAAPLCGETPGYAVGAGGTCRPVAVSYTNPLAISSKDYLGMVVNESEYECGEFLNKLVATETGVNTSLDALTTVFTALGTAFTPLATVHALTAAGSISSGWKTAIDSDVYARATIANYAQAIQATYYSDLKTYLDSLTVADAASLVPSIEVAKIRSIHKECSLASAQAAVSASLQPATVSTQSLGTQTINITDASAGDTYTITGSAATLKAPISVSYKLNSNSTPSEVVAQLVSLINSSADFQAAGVTASKGSRTQDSIVLRFPPSGGIKWTVSGQLSLVAQSSAGAVGVSGVAPAAALVPSGGITSSVVPGHAVAR
jgi:hypothetical protein